MIDSNAAATPASSYNWSGMDGSGDNEAGDTGLFERCSECGQFFVSLSRHECSPEDGPDDGFETKPHLSREERERRADDDDRDESREVILPAGTRSTRYHEIDDSATDREARCWLGPDPDEQGTRVAPQREAAERGYSPCGACRLAANTDSDDTETNT